MLFHFHIFNNKIITIIILVLNLMLKNWPKFVILLRHTVSFNVFTLAWLRADVRFLQKNTIQFPNHCRIFLDMIVERCTSFEYRKTSNLHGLRTEYLSDSLTEAQRKVGTKHLFDIPVCQGVTRHLRRSHTKAIYCAWRAILSFSR